MSPDDLTLPEIWAAVTSDPSDAAARGALIEALVQEGELDTAEEQLRALGLLTAEPTWVAQLEESIAIAGGDAVRAARCRKRYRDLLKEDEEDDRTAREASDGKPHPSLKQPRFHVVTGGTTPTAEISDAHKLSDVAGLATVKAHLSNLIDEIRNPAKQLSAAWLGGALFYGPPGCGKKFCASVVAGELDAQFVLVDATDTWSKKSLEDLLEALIQEGSTRRVVLLLDNLDEVSGTNEPAVIESLVALLRDQRAREAIVVLGSATLPWLISRKLATPGRLDKIILMLPPDAPARSLFLKKYTSELALPLEQSDIEWLVRRSDGHSFGDLKQVISLAANDRSDKIEHSALRMALQQVPSSSAEWLTVAGHHALMNKAGGMYDDLLAYFQSRQRH